MVLPRWYLVQNVRILELGGYFTDLPANVKALRHHLCCSCPANKESIVLSPDKIEGEELTYDQAEAKHMSWEMRKTSVDPDGKTVNAYQRSLMSKMGSFFTTDWDTVKDRIRGKS